MITAKTVLAQDGHIQIESEPGVTVFLNDDLKSVTSSKFGGSSSRTCLQESQYGTVTFRFFLE